MRRLETRISSAAHEELARVLEDGVGLRVGVALEGGGAGAVRGLERGAAAGRREVAAREPLALALLVVLVTTFKGIILRSAIPNNYSCF